MGLPTYSVRNMKYFKEDRIMATTLNKLLFAVTLSCIAVIACDKSRVTTENGGHEVELTQHGNIACVLVDNKVFCAPAKMRVPMRLVFSTAI